MPQYRLRTLLLIVLLWAAIGIIIYGTGASQESLIAAATKTQVETDLKLWETIHELDDDALVSSVADYTFWDDMAEFAEGKRDLTWAHENLDPGLTSFGIDALWVLDVNGAIVYSAMKAGEETGTPPPLALSRTQLEQLIATPDEEYGFVHEFYWFSDIGPLTIVGSDITSTDDPTHVKPARGYYFAARLLTEESALSHLKDIGANVRVVPLTEVPDPVDPTDIQPHVFWHEMWDVTGATIGALRIERTAPNFVELVTSSRSGRHLAVTLWILMGVVTTGLILVLGRTQQRAADLAAEMTMQLRSANTILEKRVAERTAELELDIKRRTEAEEHLKKRSEELERMNKIMIDRELRIVELKKKTSDAPPPEDPTG